jgi:hypothetical protein
MSWAIGLSVLAGVLFVSIVLLVVDAKTPPDAYLEAIDAPSEEARAAALARHARIGSLERQVLPGARKFIELGAASGEPIIHPEPIEHLVREIQSDRATTP